MVHMPHAVTDHTIEHVVTIPGRLCPDDSSICLFFNTRRDSERRRVIAWFGHLP